ncbi:MAG: hypothetical protein A3I07_00645 [Candidatus Doudnabacteria bacterium RIFCSPLOWO2_02_FULL_42_9]|uniref:Transglutaminase-like domain-containing protein n=1 Tax=Candidatus Doudnabacteria bacterium RIFCSPHIGHO2_01_FULL_41_86 TaxID=1817821 RepID=A0A1F5NAD1_9BACT|nr:MAG: hypothetical protein A2717_02655 [Candidatus Doudnabacteria bacterium RIFCSPHIGHO2_01_FULL_41_86]OGE75492.1 MAG: hypothetical protein A3K07_00985 [Candidatus Doudnabacteria bacterium RIFCSPHIGHO2_01_43_10]OGE85449.1 MAG: hypothetical protein A3E28_02225 [Candidatus Doudnabacteria bacterium RIFCSPHIGHO2_12_FULL_42_22]OGE86987.1 MAG: hypothetical protein A3C49_03060 [Candidatus Doudnabacteria bacterium RIFCSPHIGHO2_02_FULL_42_25]OGE92586.1 MAG: hypothetical protein A2895_03215 [Candidatus
MNLLLYIIIIAAIYSFIVFILLRLVTPYTGFGKLPKPKQIPHEIIVKISELETASSNSQEYLQKIYDFVTSRWHAGRFTTIFYAPLAFRTNLMKIWKSPGFAQCNTQNYIVFVMLTNSKFFKPEDIKLRTVFFNFFLHQYLKVKVGNEWINVDPAGASIRGKPLGAYISIFG